MKKLLFATLALSLCARADEPAAWQAEAAATMQKGLAWLAANEVEGKGIWGDPKFPAVTGFALWSFANSGDPQYKPQIDRAVAHLLSCVMPDGGIYVENPGRKGGGLGNYNTSICLTALHAARGSDPATLQVLLNARAYIASTQLTGDPDDDYSGGFGYDKANDRAYTDLMNTHFSLEAMRRTQGLEDLRSTAQPRADVNWQAALAYVTKLQNTGDADDAGGFFYNPTDAKAGTTELEDGKVRINSYGSITYAGFLSMIFCEVKRDDPRVVSAVDYASRHWTLDENPGLGLGSLFFYMNVMSRALTAAQMDAVPRKDAEPVAWKQELAARLSALQKEDGSWSNTDNRWWESDPSLVTSYALIALQFATGAK